MKDPLIVSAAQFEHKSGDKDYNLSVIEALSAKAAHGSRCDCFSRMFNNRLHFCPSSFQGANAGFGRKFLMVKASRINDNSAKK